VDYREISPDPGSATRGNAASAARQEKRGTVYGMLFLPLLLITLLVLSACASISEEECLAADWYSRGVEDGSRGYPMSRIGAYRKDCAEVGVAPDAEQYGQGRMVGLESFCTYERGYAEGKRGASNKAVCPPGPLEAEFAQGYNDGHYVYGVKQDIRKLERELASVRQEMVKIRGELDSGYWVDSSGKEYELRAYERDARYESLRALSKEEGHLEDEIAALRNSIAGS
jgi:hypothetical protein